MIHLVPRTDWEARPDEPYRPASLDAEGFVHCAGDDTVALAVANAFYRDAPRPLLALVLDEDALDATVRWEAADPAPPAGVGDDVLFPHVYGPLRREAVEELQVVRWDDADRAVALEPYTPH